jgi:hypothetical protein
MGVTTAIQSANRKIRTMISGSPSEPEILDTLKQEHEEVAESLKKLVAGNSAAARKAVLGRINAALLPHIQAEQTVLYDALIAIGDRNVQQGGQEGYIEHELAASTLAKLESIPSAMSPEFGAAAKVLKELIEHHVQEEERHIWAGAKDKFSAEQRVALNQKYLAAKERTGAPEKKMGAGPVQRAATVSQPKKVRAAPRKSGAPAKGSVASKRSRSAAGTAI